MEMNTALKLIQELPPKTGSYIIAVDGFGGSGKSTIATKLGEYLPDSIIVEMDDFVNKEHFYDDSWELAFNRKAVKAHVVSLANDGRNRYIIVEGISSMHPELASMYDFTVWVDTPIDVAKSRGQLRDKGNENENRWDLWAANDLKYLNQYSPKDNADAIIVNANNSIH